MQHTQQWHRGISCVPPYPLQKLTLTSWVNVRTKVPPKPGWPCRPSLFYQLDTTVMSEKLYTMSWDDTALLGTAIELSLFLSSNTLLVGWMYSCYCMNIRVLSHMRFTSQHRPGLHFVWSKSIIRLPLLWGCARSIHERHLAYLLLTTVLFCDDCPYQAWCLTLQSPLNDVLCCNRAPKAFGICLRLLLQTLNASANHLHCHSWLVLGSGL